MFVAPAVIAKCAGGRDGRSHVSCHRGGMYRRGWTVTTEVRRAWNLRDEGRVARYGRPCRRVDRGQLALSLPAARKAGVSAGGRRVTSPRVGYVLEGDGALHVFAGEHCRVLPLYEYPDIRRGHGRRAVGGRRKDSLRR